MAGGLPLHEGSLGYSKVHRDAAYRPQGITHPWYEMGGSNVRFAGIRAWSSAVCVLYAGRTTMSAQPHRRRVWPLPATVYADRERASSGVARV